MEELKKLFIEKVEIKIIIGSLAAFFSWGFDGEYEALLAIGILVILDIGTGTWYSISTGQWSSRKSLGGLGKVFRYLSYMLMARMLDKVVPLKIWSPLMDTFVAITEAGSILENFYKLGYPVPTMIVNKLKTFNDKKS